MTGESEIVTIIDTDPDPDDAITAVITCNDWRWRGLMAVASIASIVALDGLTWLIDPAALGDRLRYRVLLLGLLDSPAHLATTVLALVALTAWRPALPLPFWLGALLTSVAIDLDHLPVLLAERLGWQVPTLFAEDHWPLHNLPFIALLTALVLVFSGRWRLAVSGVAFGVTVELVRDVATGGVAPLWPIATDRVTLPYRVYAAALLVLVALACRPPRGREKRG